MGIKQLYNEILQKLPNEYRDVSVMQTGPKMQNPWSNYCNGLKNDPSHWQVEIFSTYYIYLWHQIIHNYS